jgi:hypothetical protein
MTDLLVQYVVELDAWRDAEPRHEWYIVTGYLSEKREKLFYKEVGARPGIRKTRGYTPPRSPRRPEERTWREFLNNIPEVYGTERLHKRMRELLEIESFRSPFIMSPYLSTITPEELYETLKSRYGEDKLPLVTAISLVHALRFQDDFAHWRYWAENMIYQMPDNSRVSTEEAEYARFDPGWLFIPVWSGFLLQWVFSPDPVE